MIPKSAVADSTWLSRFGDGDEASAVCDAERMGSTWLDDGEGFSRICGVARIDSTQCDHEGNEAGVVSTWVDGEAEGRAVSIWWDEEGGARVVSPW